MRIEVTQPAPPPPLFSLHFSRDEGWAVVAALREYAENHPGAARGDEWRQWSADLDQKIRNA